MNFVLFCVLSHINCIEPPNGAVLIVIDGAGESSWPEGNSLMAGKTPTLDYLKQNFPYASLVAAQQPVGLIRGEPGSSAVGHQTLGLGRTTPSYYQTLMTTLRPNATNSLTNNKLLRNSFSHAKAQKGRIHFAGQCTDSGVFAHTKFLTPMFEAAKQEGFDHAYVHCSLMSMSKKPSEYLKDVNAAAPPGFQAIIGSVHSSETSMDKSGHWEWTAKSYEAMVNPSAGNLTTREKGEAFLDTFTKASPVFDPLVFDRSATLQNEDVLVLFNFREDKSYQMAHALIRGLDGYTQLPDNLHVIPMVLYDRSLIDIPTILPAIEYPNSLGSWLSKHGVKQLRLAESYKRPHVTTFFSGGILQPLFPGEDRIIVDSPSDSKAERHPEMNASLVTSIGRKMISKGEHKFIMMNYANIDATGHSGNAAAVKTAIEFVDSKIGEILSECEAHNYALFITADHGNGEENTNLDGSRQVDHTVNTVPFLTNVKQFKIKNPTYGKTYFIGNVAPTILHVLGMPIPPEMEESMFVEIVSSVQCLRSIQTIIVIAAAFILGIGFAPVFSKILRRLRCLHKQKDEEAVVLLRGSAYL